uniref:Reverse transcriptase domain-containing protein n=1 Tax=Tanacetum cinerariifolium TaxID=118510 RepID=A0A6L2JUW1_TANCI|nr:hypothetical protein [Tanacetum cinerariifolium]
MGKASPNNEFGEELRAMRITRESEIKVMNKRLAIDKKRGEIKKEEKELIREEMELKEEERKTKKMYLLHLNDLLTKDHLSPEKEDMKRNLKCFADESSVITLDDIEIDIELTTRKELVAIQGRKSRQLRNKVNSLVKVKWKHRKGTSVRWEPEEKMRIRYHHLFQE